MEINSISELEKYKKDILRDDIYCTFDLRYRGVEDEEYELNSTLERETDFKLSFPKLKELEEKKVKLFIENPIIKSKIKKIPIKQRYGEDWTNLIQAQHAGIHTTLIDWTADLKVALFFCIRNKAKDNVNGKIWIQKLNKSSISSDYNEDYNFYNFNPKTYEEELYFSPINFQQNIKFKKYEFWRFKQKGEFSINTKLHSNIFHVIIPAKNKAKIREELKKLNLDEEYYFVNREKDIDKIVEQINTIKF